MRRLILALFGVALLAGIPAVHAQGPADPNEGSRLIYDNANAIYRFSWWGKAGRTYFIQQSDDLSLWTYLPIIEPGTDQVKQWGFTSTAPKFFLRLKISDQTAADPYAADFDGDSVSNQEELNGGTNPLGIADANHDGIPDEWSQYALSKLTVYPPSINATLFRGQTAQRPLFLYNPTDQAVNYSISISGNSLPGYSFKDSLAGGATFAWEDISATGALLPAVSNADDASESFTLVGFSFLFYGQSFNTIYVSSNGHLTFGGGSRAYANMPLPSASAPPNLIAPFWDDLDTRTSGDIYYKEETDRCIIQYQDVKRYGGGATYTFQVVLFSDGRIEFRYLSLGGITDSATVGIQDRTGLLGLQMACNATYLANNMTIAISPRSEFLSVTPVTGIVPAHSIASLSAFFESFSFPFGTHAATVSISHDAVAGGNPQPISAALDVLNTPSTVALAAPAAGSAIVEGESIILQASASDPDGISKVEFYNGGTKIGETIYSPYEFYWYRPPPGVHTLAVRAIDTYGAVTKSAAVTFTVLADSDSDGMPDAWEISFGLNPAVSNAGADSDGDGALDLDEYRAGTNPTVQDTDGDQMPDGYEIAHKLNPLADDGADDADKDGLANLQEYQHGTNPRNFDTDGDLLPDGWEVLHGLNPLGAVGADGAEGDPDGDGLNNLGEYLHSTEPQTMHSDADGVDDRQEVENGSNPVDASDGGQPPPPEEMKELPFSVYGDYASWEMTVTGKGPEDKRVLKLLTDAPGASEGKTLKLRRGNRYEITMRHLKSMEGEPQQWWCWEAKVDGLPSAHTYNSYSSERLEGAATAFVVGGHWLVDNAEGLLTSHVHMREGAGSNIAGTAKATLLPVEITFEPVGDNEPITDNKNPVTKQWMPGHGKRIFPDWKKKNDNTQRNRVYVKVKVGMPNIRVHLKAFDVDDPSDDLTIDPNDQPGLKSGQDNLEFDGITHSPKPPYFIANGSETIVCTTDAEGVAKFNGGLPVMEVTMQPGDNFRVAAALMDGNGLSSLQVMDKNAAGYIAGDTDQQPSGFSGVASPMLTTWRKLHIEVDTMTKWQGNKPSPDRTTATGTSWAADGTRRSTLTLSAALPQGADFYAGGFIKSGAVQFDIAGNTTTTITILHPGGATPPTEAELNSFIGQQFEVHDDDDRGAGNTLLDLLTQANVISADVKKAHAPAYIEIEEVPHSPEFNDNPTIPFELNAGTLYNPFTSLNDSQDMSGADREEYWYTLLVVAYQYTEGKDNDPLGEDLIRGLTVGHSFIWPNFSTVYMEAIRELTSLEAPFGSDITAPLARDFHRVVSHELGHACGIGNDEDHAEGGLMNKDADEDEFSAKTLRRFRMTPKWQQ